MSRGPRPSTLKDRTCAGRSAERAAWIALAALVACGPRLSGRAGDGAASARAYVIKNRQELEHDVGVGSGSTIFGLAIVAGCQNQRQLGRTLHRQREELFPSPAVPDDVVAQNVVSAMARESQARCVDLLRGPSRPFLPGRYQVVGRRSATGRALRYVGEERFQSPDR